MNPIILNQFLSQFFIYEIEYLLPYLILSAIYPVRVKPGKLCLYMIAGSAPFATADAVYNIFFNSHLIPPNLFIMLAMGCIMTMSLVANILFIICMLDAVWYQCLWIAFIFEVLDMIPVLMLQNRFLNSANANGYLYIKPITLHLLPRYLQILGLGILWSFVLYLIARKVMPLIVERAKAIPRWTWYLAYLSWAYLLMTSRLPVSYVEYGKYAIYFSNMAKFKIVFQITLAICIIVSLLIAFFDKRILKVENLFLKEQLQLQYENYLSINKQEEQLHKLYHDIGNHINTIEALIDQNDTQKAKEYTNTLNQKYRDIRSNYYCHNPIVNVVLSQKAKLCKDNNISTDFNILFPEKCSIADIDLMSIFSNLLDNAIEGCLNSPSDTDSKYINVTVSVHGEYLVMKVVNSKSAEKNSKNDSIRLWKKSKNLHGYGLKIVEEIVSRYQGHQEILDQGSEYSCSILLSMPGN